MRTKKKRLRELTDEESVDLTYNWKFWARANQLPPINALWNVWLILSGRGWGKTRTGAEFIRDRIENGYNGPVHLIGATAADVRDVMIEGESGLLAISPPWNMPVYIPSKRRLIWPNGAIGLTFSGERPDRLRGPQCGLLWADEIAAWKYQETWDMAMFGWRLRHNGQDPKAIATTTPRPIPVIKELMVTKGVVVTKGTSYENRANLAEMWFDSVILKHEGTRLGQQEIHAEILEDTPGAVWTLDAISMHRVSYEEFKSIELVRIAVAIDPAVTSGESSNETGIIAGGIDKDGEGYLLHDRSGRYTPIGWAKKAIELYELLHADRIVAEINNGGDMVESTLRSVDPKIPYTKVHASRGKRTRAEPVSALYEQGLVHHVGIFPTLEDQMTTWDAEDGSPSPDRLDAAVWLFSYLMLTRLPGRKAKSRAGTQRKADSLTPMSYKEKKMKVVRRERSK